MISVCLSSATAFRNHRRTKRVELNVLIPGRRTATNRSLLAATVVVILVALCACSSSTKPSNATPEGQSPTADADDRASKKPDITRLTTTMIVGESSFPTIEGAVWSPPNLIPVEGGLIGGTEMEPAECMPLLAWSPLASEWAFASLNAGRAGGNRGIYLYSVEIGLPKERPDYAELVTRCGTVTRNATTVTFAPYPIDGLPSWSTSVLRSVPSEDAEAISIFGEYRGALLVVQVQRDSPLQAGDTAAVAKIFNDQVAQLEAA